MRVARNNLIFLGIAGCVFASVVPHWLEAERVEARVVTSGAFALQPAPAFLVTVPLSGVPLGGVPLASPFSDCTAGAECPEGMSCQVGQGQFERCVPYATEGEICGGQGRGGRRCEPALACETSETVEGSPPVCRRPCDVGADCRQGECCDAQFVCRTADECSARTDAVDAARVGPSAYPLSPRSFRR